MRLNNRTINQLLNPNTFGPTPSVTVNSVEPEMSVSECATEIGVTPQAIRKAIDQMRLKARKIGKQHVIDRLDFNAFKERYGYEG